jgi:tetratricopeptide (TPR) repeat protein
MWSYAAAAAVVAGLILSWQLFIRPAPLQQLARDYIKENYHTIGVTMGGQDDEIQKGLQLYNTGNLPQALPYFEKLVNLDHADFTAVKYAGITSLRLQQYDKALHYFKLLSEQPGLYANPGIFLQAITLLKRNLPADKQTARKLLVQVVENDLEGKETAEQWLKKW